MPTSDLRAIIGKSVDGDLKAFATLVERFQDMAVGYAYSILGDFQLAEDAAQEAFVDAHRNIGQLREPKAFSSWFRRIVNRVPVDDWSWGNRVRLVAWKSDQGIHVRPGLETWFWVDEAAGESEQILGAIGRLARQSGHDGVKFDRLHYRSSVARELRQLEGANLTVRSPNYYLRILNLQSVFAKLAPELALRLKDSSLADWKGDLVIANGEEEVVLAIDWSLVKVVPVGRTEHLIKGGGGILQLVVGTDTPDQVVEMGGIELGGDARHLVRALFTPCSTRRWRTRGCSWPCQGRHEADARPRQKIPGQF